MGLQRLTRFGRRVATLSRPRQHKQPVAPQPHRPFAASAGSGAVPTLAAPTAVAGTAAHNNTGRHPSTGRNKMAFSLLAAASWTLGRRGAATATTQPAASAATASTTTAPDYTPIASTEPETLMDFELEAMVKTKSEVFTARKTRYCQAQTVSYSNTDPIMFVAGDGAYMIDEHGDRYLDTRNNVAHVGHANQQVAAAVSRQIKALNTNSRYLHPNQDMLSRELLSLFPEGLDTVFFVNSGTEATDLAIALSRAHTKSRNMICVDHAYHGHSIAVFAISPYKYEKAKMYEPWVQKVPCPNTYSGQFRGSNAADQYVATVEAACDKALQNGGLGGFIVESGLAVGGAVVLPDRYLERCYAAVRAAGGVCIADEVQVGFGRVGTHWWNFEQQGVVPDIVTVGKPFGNGMPIAAVVCKKAVAQSFTDRGVEYFNTYGGNPVACAAGLSVIEILKKNDLRQHALDTGSYMLERFQKLVDRHPLLGEVRGTGFFMGLEFVVDRETREPATREVSYIISRLRSEFKILTSIDGPGNNVIIVKPPMCFNKSNVDTFVDAVDHVLSTLGPIPEDIGNTPT
eukprot:m.478312 g.478312  ORF g.478312 m.478312 type:complete len:572 (+) comp21105_c0_seq1:264-1979(+)